MRDGAVVMPCEVVNLFFFVTKILNISSHHANVGTQLPFLLIVHSRPLLTGPISGDGRGDQCSEQKKKNANFHRPLNWPLFLLNVVMVGFGFWVGLFWSFRHL
jgi:hypothetical protein